MVRSKCFSGCVGVLACLHTPGSPPFEKRPVSQPTCPPSPRSNAPYAVRRAATACLLSLASGSNANQQLLLQHEDSAGPDDEREGMAQLVFGRLLRTCGDYVMQASFCWHEGWLSRALPRRTASRVSLTGRGVACRGKAQTAADQTVMLSRHDSTGAAATWTTTSCPCSLLFSLNLLLRV